MSTESFSNGSSKSFWKEIVLLILVVYQRFNFTVVYQLLKMVLIVNVVGIFFVSYKWEKEQVPTAIPTINLKKYFVCGHQLKADSIPCWFFFFFLITWKSFKTGNIPSIWGVTNSSKDKHKKLHKKRCLPAINEFTENNYYLLHTFSLAMILKIREQLEINNWNALLLAKPAEMKSHRTKLMIVI